MKNLISVIVPAFNDEKYIEKCIQSIINQTYQNLEIILIDDGSVDRTAEICFRYAQMDNRIKFFVQAHGGVVTARNRGIKIASGKYVSFIDADDWLDCNAYEMCMEHMEESDLFVFGHYEDYEGYILKRFGEIPSGSYIGRKKMEYIWKNMMYFNRGDKNGITQMLWNKIFKLEILRSVYQEVDETIYSGEDVVLLNLYLLRCNSIKIMDEYLYHYNIHENSAIRSTDKKFFENMSRLYNCLEPKFRMHYLKDELLYQLEKYIVDLIPFILNEKLKFCDEMKIPKYMIKRTDLLKGRKILLYGAGVVGKDYYLQLMREQVFISIWVDKNYERFQAGEYDVRSIEEINDTEFDFALIAILDDVCREDIKQDLLRMGIAEEKIYDDKPGRLFG